MKAAAHQTKGTLERFYAQTKYLIAKAKTGTGKTTVSRLIAKLFKSLGVSSRDHVVEDDLEIVVTPSVRPGLVAGLDARAVLIAERNVSGAPRLEAGNRRTVVGDVAERRAGCEGA